MKLTVYPQVYLHKQTERICKNGDSVEYFDEAQSHLSVNFWLEMVSIEKQLNSVFGQV